MNIAELREIANSVNGNVTGDADADNPRFNFHADEQHNADEFAALVREHGYTTHAEIVVTVFKS